MEGKKEELGGNDIDRTVHNIVEINKPFEAKRYHLILLGDPLYFSRSAFNSSIAFSFCVI
jgi:hypothetical protein